MMAGGTKWLVALLPMSARRPILSRAEQVRAQLMRREPGDMRDIANVFCGDAPVWLEPRMNHLTAKAERPADGRVAHLFGDVHEGAIVHHDALHSGPQ